MTRRHVLQVEVANRLGSNYRKLLNSLSMTTTDNRIAGESVEALLLAFDTNDRINRYMIENLPAEAWRAEPPGGKGRTIAAIVAHIHNVRVMWLKASAKGSKIPEQLDRSSVTATQAAKALDQSRAALRSVIESALKSDGRVKGFRPDVSGFFAYLIAHDAHHRGQVCMLARQVGRPLPQKAMFGMWEWGTRGKV